MYEITSKHPPEPEFFGVAEIEGDVFYLFTVGTQFWDATNGEFLASLNDIREPYGEGTKMRIRLAYSLDTE